MCCVPACMSRNKCWIVPARNAAVPAALYANAVASCADHVECASASRISVFCRTESFSPRESVAHASLQVS